MNHLEKLNGLKNNYFLLRHGQSEANVAGVIVGDPDRGTKGFGLTEKGREQVRESVSRLKGEGDFVIFSSDFLRARESAEIAREILGVDEVIVSERLRERFFGSLEGQDISNYRKVWQNDPSGEHSSDLGVEGTGAVLDRVSKLVLEIEEKYAGRNVLLVSHGDTLQILLAGFRGIDAGRHRETGLLGTGEIFRA